MAEDVLEIPVKTFQLGHCHEIWDRFDDTDSDGLYWQTDQALLAMRELDQQLAAEEASLINALCYSNRPLPSVEDADLASNAFRLHERQSSCQGCKSLFFPTSMQWQCAECDAVVCTACSRHRRTPTRFLSASPSTEPTSRVCDRCVLRLDSDE
jgi:hypothetical protein